MTRAAQQSEGASRTPDVERTGPAWAFSVGTNELLVLDIPSEASETAPLVETPQC